MLGSTALIVIQVEKLALIREQSFKIAVLNNAAVFEYEYAADIFKCGEVVRDDEHGFSGKDAAEILYDSPFSFKV